MYINISSGRETRLYRVFVVEFQALLLQDVGLQCWYAHLFLNFQEAAAKAGTSALAQLYGSNYIVGSSTNVLCKCLWFNLMQSNQNQTS